MNKVKILIQISAISTDQNPTNKTQKKHPFTKSTTISAFQLAVQDPWSY